MRRIIPLVIILVVLTITIVMGKKELEKAKQTAKGTAAAAPASALQPASPDSGANPPHVRGLADAPVRLEEFGDFQCPPCNQLYQDLRAIESDYGPRLAVVFRQFPLVQIHNHALEAARAAEAAGLQGKFWEMHDRLFEQQAVWSRKSDVLSSFVQYAQELGLDVARFAADFNSPAVNIRTGEDQRRGEHLGVTGTPSVFVNGQRVSGFTPDVVRAAIDAALSQKGL